MANRSVAARPGHASATHRGKLLLSHSCRYGVATLAVAAALGATLLLNHLGQLQNTQAALFVVAVMVSSWYGGLGPGLLATALSTLALSYFLLEPLHPLTTVNLETVVQLAVFAVAALLISSLNQSQRQARQQAELNLQFWRDSESRFSHLTEANVIGIIEADFKGAIIKANDAFLRMVGYTREDLLAGRVRWSEMILPEYQAVSEQSQLELQTTGFCPPFETEYIRKDGSRVPVLIGLAMQNDHQVTGFVFNLSESRQQTADRQRAEMLLRESEQRWYTLANSIPSLVWTAAPDGAITWACDAWYAYTGITPAQNSRNWPQVLHPDDRERCLSQWQQALAAGTPYSIEVRNRRHDGEYRWFLTEATPVRNTAGQITAWFGTTTDIHERKLDQLNKQFIADLDMRVRQLSDPPAMIWEMVSSLGAYLHGNRCNLAEINAEADQVTVQQVWSQDGFRPIGTYALADFITSDLQADFVAGQPMTVADVATDARTAAFADDYHSLQIRAFAAVPCIYQGHWVAVLALHSALPRLWHADEVALMQEAVAHIWPLIEQTRAVQALRESEARFRHMADTAPVLVWMSGTDRRCDYFNQPWLDFTGRTLEQEWGDGWAAGVHPDDLQDCLNTYQTAFDAHQEFKMEYRLRRFDGEYGWVLDHGVPRFTPNGEFLGYIGSCVDIHDRKQAEAALAANEYRLRGFVESNVVGILYGDIYGGVNQANDALLNMIGYSRADLQAGKIRWDKITPPEHLPLDEQAIAEARERGACTPYEKEYIRQDGRRVPVLVGYSLVGSAREESVAFILDLTQQKQVEANLRQFKLLIELSHEPILVWDLEQGIILWNHGCEQFYGYSQAEAIGQDTHRLLKTVHPIGRAEFMAILERDQQWTGELQQTRQDGKLVIVSSRQQLVETNGQRLVLETNRDITDQKQIAMQRERLLQQEQEARQAAEQANRIKDEFLAVLSHELRSPLNPILGWSKLLQTHTFPPEKTMQALSTIERNARLQSQLIEDLLDVSRILQGKMVLNTQPVNLATTVEAAMETVRLAAEAKSMQIRAVLDREIGTVAGDAARLQQIVWNLLTNAVKFTPDGGAVEVRLSRENNMAQIQVQDTGKGIDPAFLPYVFDYFRQEDGATTRRFGGLGLGLAIVRYLTEQHGGTVSVSSEGEGKGATFTIQIPLRTSPPQLDEATPENSVAGLHRLKILVVDDEPDMRDLMLTLLEEQGATVRLAASATEALTVLPQWHPDLLISDIGMPEVDGYMLIRQLRSLSPEQGGNIPAIALTAYAGEIDQQQALKAGFQTHLAKPVEAEELVSTILQLQPSG